MPENPRPVFWSAVPTPLTNDLTVDPDAVSRVIDDAVQSGMAGLFLGGTCGEGPWLPDVERRRLVETAAKAANGRLCLAAQVSDNSVPRVRDNIRQMADAGADVAIVSSPATFLNATADRIVDFFAGAVDASELPVGVYDLGEHRPVHLPVDRLAEIYRLPKVCLVKDSSGNVERRAQALAVARERPDLQLFNGDEFRCLEYLEAGYTGMMFGGAIAIAAQMHRIASRWVEGDLETARAEDEAMRQVLFGIYGGSAITCWLTGLKHYLVRRGLFTSEASFLGYPLTDDCRAFIEQLTAESA
ncbi:dihydrodipicolinate synthase family protein [Actomonas aquatica]|uniref:Dihydrodipicolinate synthase family protein n=1 Tax=Actomonas aquatica TaxID=2866162 RepID=A0ABZ1CFN9_9BACT|nr:dihydrodipicolinate synthase family protein [Opitutus sp. WL0086]WRQ90112.1 dihydrodipicolinate synthase family protein [Opitutus sp. WL0086]